MLKSLASFSVLLTVADDGVGEVISGGPAAVATDANAITIISTLTNFIYPFILSLPPDLTNDLTIYHQLIKRSNYIKPTYNHTEPLDQNAAIHHRHPHPHQTGGELFRKITNRPLSGRSKRSGVRFCSYDSRLWACRVDRNFPTDDCS